jgi:hypothetical protein
MIQTRRSGGRPGLSPSITRCPRMNHSVATGCSRPTAAGRPGAACRRVSTYNGRFERSRSRDSILALTGFMLSLQLTSSKGITYRLALTRHLARVLVKCGLANRAVRSKQRAGQAPARINGGARPLRGPLTPSKINDRQRLPKGYRVQFRYNPHQRPTSLQFVATCRRCKRK